MKEIYWLIKNWGFSDECLVRQIERVTGGEMYLVQRAESEKYLLKSTERMERLLVEEDLLKHLLKEGIKVFPPIRTCCNEPVVKCGSVIYCLYEYIEGEHLKYDSFEKLCYAAGEFGRILGHLHKALKKYSNDSGFIKKMNLHHSIFNWCLPKINREMKDEQIMKDIRKYESRLRTAFDRNDMQFIHRDFHGDNIMFKDDAFIGIIDFEICMMGYRIFDIAYLITSMLVGDFEDADFRSNWLKMIPILIRSYDSVNPLRALEREDIYSMLLSVQLIFTAYYLGHDGTERANKNLSICRWLLVNENEIKRKFIEN